MEKLKPCPICGSFNISVTKTRIMCCSCGVAVHADNGFQINGFHFDRWNALPRRLKWTREKPTVEGFYWWRLEEGCYQHLRKVVYVSYTKRWIVSMYNSDVFENLDDNDGEWAGPIPEPEEE